MKKLIAIAVVFALIASAAFADTVLTGGLTITGELVNGDNKVVEDGDGDPHYTPLGTGAIGVAGWQTQIGVTFGDANAGGKLVHNSTNVAVEHFYGWWRPIPQVRFQMGKNSDGDFGAAQITGWGFTSEAKNIVAIDSNKYASVGFYPGHGGANFNFSIFPIDGLTVNLVFPWSGGTFVSNIVKTHINVVYALEGIGTARLSYISDTGYVKPADYEWFPSTGITDTSASPKIFASFFLTALEGMAVDFGLAYKFPFVVKNDVMTITTNHPLEIGIGYRLTLGDFGLKVRTGFTFGGTVEVKMETGPDPDPARGVTQIGIDILPSYKLGNITAFLNAGLQIDAIEDYKETSILSNYQKNESNAIVGWFINPYILIPTDAMRFMVGLKVWSDGVKYMGGDAPLVRWAIPFGFYVYF